MPKPFTLAPVATIDRDRSRDHRWIQCQRSAATAPEVDVPGLGMAARRSIVDSTAPRLVACWIRRRFAHTASAAAASPRTSNEMIVPYPSIDAWPRHGSDVWRDPERGHGDARVLSEPLGEDARAVLCPLQA